MPLKPKVDERPSRVHKRSARYLREAKALGARIRALREAQGWTLERMAERCDLDLKHLQKIESGQLNVTLVTIVRLAVGLERPIAVLSRRRRRPRRADNLNRSAMISSPVRRMAHRTVGRFSRRLATLHSRRSRAAIFLTTREDDVVAVGGGVGDQGEGVVLRAP